MYNEKIKREFLDTINSKDVKAAIETIFKKSAKYEEEAGADLYCFPKDEAAKFIMDNFRVNKVQTLRSKASYITRYQKWALEKGYMPEEYRGLIHEKIKYNIFFEEGSKFIVLRTPRDVMKLIVENFNNLDYVGDGITTDDLFAGYIILLFEGFTKEEIADLTPDNIMVTDTNVSIVNKHRAIVLSEEFENKIKKLKTNRTFLSRMKETYGYRQMGEELLNSGSDKNKDGFIDKLTVFLVENLHDKDLLIRLDDIYYYGLIYQLKKAGAPKIDRRALLIREFGENYTQGQRETIYNAIRRYEKEE